MSAIEKRKSHELEPVGAVSGLGMGLIVAPTLAWLLSVMPIIPGGFLFWVIAVGIMGLVLLRF